MATVLGSILIIFSIIFVVAANNAPSKAEAIDAPSKPAATNTPSKQTAGSGLKHLSLSMTNVGQLLKEGYVYVDKTHFVVKLLKSPRKYYLLTRPRHFGKTTFLNTFKEIFENGDKKLFNGTAIYKSDFTWPTHPVVSISLSDGMKISSPEELKESLVEALKKVGTSYEITSLDGTDVKEVVQHLVSMLHQKFSKRVIILIDAYDYPYTELHEHEELAEKISDVVRVFLAAIHSMDEDIRFCLMTGVVKLAGCNLDAWTDITLEEAYTTIAGFTQEELERDFAGHIDIVAKHRRNTTREQVLSEIKNWYDGHRFTSLRTSVYSPWSIISYFMSKKLQDGWPQWFSTRFMGLKKKIAKYPDSALDYLHGRRVYAKKFIEQSHLDRMWDEGLNELEALLLQTGCLSIKKYDPKRDALKLGFANREVRETFFQVLFRGFSKKKQDELVQTVSGLKGDLARLDLATFVRKANQYITTFLSNNTDADDSLSPNLPRNKMTDEILHVIFRIALMNADVHIDPETSMADRLESLTIFIDGKRYLLELKLSEDPLDVCIEHYKRRYPGQNVVCVGLKFDCKNVKIADCDVAEMSKEGEELKRVSLYEFEYLNRDDGEISPPPPEE